MAFKAHSFGDGISHLLDSDLFIFPNCADYGLRIKGKVGWNNSGITYQRG
jgi:hypothetical protein